jgi:putative sugar O-methyltransferase
MALEEPSLFWSQLSAEHQRELEEFGLERMKRHQALEYFTWRWTWRTIHYEPQARFLLRNTGPPTLLRCALEPAKLSDEAWDGIPWPKRERWLYVFMVRLLIEYARSHDTTGATRLEEPTLGDPPPVLHRGRPVSQDLANSALEVGAIARALVGREPSSMVEIGGGYGRVAYVMLNLYPKLRYTVVDIEPALTISRWYLSQLFDPERLRFLAPDEIGTLGDGDVDLGVAISSLHEMTEAQVKDYLDFLDRVVAPGGTVYLKQWEQWSNPADGIALRFSDYPVPPRWRLDFREAAPVQTAFQQAGWTIPADGGQEANS